MATDLSITGYTIIEDALKEIGVLAAEETASAYQTTHGRRILNMMVKGWQGSPNIFTSGLKMWAREAASLTLKSQISYSFKAADGDLDIDPPVDILSVTLKDSNDNETVLSPMLLGEYKEIGNKTETGTPTRFYYEKLLTEGLFYLNRIPSDTTSTIEFVYLRPLTIIEDSDDTPDFPQHWYMALTKNLAINLCPSYEVTPDRELKGQAAYWLAIAQTVHPENANIYFEPGRD